jgi:hypothetical protein
VYHDPKGSEDGIRWLRLKPGDDGEARIALEAKGSALLLPAPASTTRFFRVEPAVTVELINGGTHRCWFADFDARATRRNDGRRYETREAHACPDASEDARSAPGGLAALEDHPRPALLGCAISTTDSGSVPAAASMTTFHAAPRRPDTGGDPYRAC